MSTEQKEHEELEKKKEKLTKELLQLSLAERHLKDETKTRDYII